MTKISTEILLPTAIILGLILAFGPAALCFIKGAAWFFGFDIFLFLTGTKMMVTLVWTYIWGIVISGCTIYNL